MKNVALEIRESARGYGEAFAGAESELAKLRQVRADCGLPEIIIALDGSLEQPEGDDTDLAMFMARGRVHDDGGEAARRAETAAADDLASIIYTSGTKRRPCSPAIRRRISGSGRWATLLRRSRRVGEAARSGPVHDRAYPRPIDIVGAFRTDQALHVDGSPVHDGGGGDHAHAQGSSQGDPAEVQDRHRPHVRLNRIQVC